MKNLKNSELKRAILKKKLAEAIGFSEDYISKIERNERPITDYILEKLNNLKKGKQPWMKFWTKQTKKTKKKRQKN